jgi:hypothetical protein
MVVDTMLATITAEIEEAMAAGTVAVILTEGKEAMADTMMDMAEMEGMVIETGMAVIAMAAATGMAAATDMAAIDMAVVARSNMKVE